MKKNKRFVFDTNTLVSAFLLSSNTIAARAYYKAIETGELVLSDNTFNEFSDVFIRPKFDRYVPLSKRMIIIEDLRSVVKVVPVKAVIEICRDHKDDKFLELAVDANATCIVTGDMDLLVLNPFRQIPIVTAADFLKLF